MHFRIVIVATLLLAPTISANQPLSPSQLEFFEKRVRPIFVTHCYECHSQQSKKVQGKLLLDTRDGIRKGGRSGPTLVPGRPAESLLIIAVRHEDKDLRMPPKVKLPAKEIGDLEAWVKMGAPDPREGKASVPNKGGEIDIAKGKKFWSFRPLGNPKPPAVKNAAWPRTDIDRFILAELERRDLTPVADADGRTLLRRATFDLTGLPPTPADIADFVNAWNAKDADRKAVWAKTVDRLLASPAYGERWGRHWLDVVRYADTAGDNSDYPIPQMYLYRNWVIDAFNRDMPYDQFVREQLSGDLLPSPSVRGVGGEGDDAKSKTIATGYLANSRRHGSYEDARYPWNLTIEDTIDNLGKTFLGVTIHCSRCHDHKFDPFTQEDYYALYGFFSSTRYPWPGIELDKTQHDLVPIASKADIDKANADRKLRLTRLDDAIKKLEASKASAEQIRKARGERDAFSKEPLPIAQAYAVIDGKNEAKKRIGQVGNARVQVKGDADRLGKEVPRRFPLVLGGQTLASSVKGSGRLELAKWITDPANPLTARVMVNRIWQYHFGAGIVPTANDFGKQGRPPTHPELLDHLAGKFMHPSPPTPLPKGERGNVGWSIKAMHRAIMLSRVYQLASDEHDANLKIDVGNLYHWRFARHRLDAEAIRDALLAVSGNLDRTPGGPHPFPAMKTWNFTQHKPFKAVYESNRRSVYLMTQRIARHPFLALFDGPDTNASTAARPTTTTPLQALFLMNDPFVHAQAKSFAARLVKLDGDDTSRVEQAFLLSFARPPSAEESRRVRDHLTTVTDRLRKSNTPADRARAQAWESVARALFMSNEFVYVN